MRIIIVIHYFPPETGAPLARLSGLATAWAADGDDVTVLTGMSNHPTGVIPPECRGAIRRRERRDHFRVLSAWLHATPNDGIARKTIGHLSLMLNLLLGGRSSGPADVIVVSSPTFFSLGAGWLLARLQRARLVVEVRDLWPAISTELGVLTNRRLFRLLERLELVVHAAADNAIVVSDGFRANLITRGVPADKVHTIRNGVRPGELDPAAPAAAQLRARFGASANDCLVLYAGTHGISQGLTSVADAAVQLTEEPIPFAFVGDGADKQRLQDRVAEHGLRDVTLLPSLPHEQVPALLAPAGQTPHCEITVAVDRMRYWPGAVLTPDGQVSLLNDGYPVDRQFLAPLRSAPDPVTPARSVLVLPETGLVRAVAGGCHLLADVGPPCPLSLPAHAHADTLSCLVHVDKVPLLADTGTSTYEPGPVRRYERSTAAHRTVQVDGTDSTEVWGDFRAGRRAWVSGLSVHTGPSGTTFEAAHDGFRCLPGRPFHHRRWSLTRDGLRVEDTVTGRSRHEIVVRWQLAAGSAVRATDGAALVTSPAGAFSASIAATAPVLLVAETSPAAVGFGSTTDAPVLAWRINAALPVRATTVWSRARDRSAGGEM